MKSQFILLIFTLTLLLNANAQNSKTANDDVVVIEDYDNLFRFQNIYVSGQPSLDVLKWFKLQDGTTIINLRSEEENEEYTAYAFNEKAIATDMGFEYKSLPVGGTSDYTPEKLAAFASLINPDEKILIHCRSAGRVSNFLIAYLIKNKEYSVNDAVKIGKKLKFALPFEKLLGTEIKMRIEE